MSLDNSDRDVFNQIHEITYQIKNKRTPLRDPQQIRHLNKISRTSSTVFGLVGGITKVLAKARSGVYWPDWGGGAGI